MHTRLTFLLFVATSMPFAASAELQTVQVGGSIQIYGHYYTPFWDSSGLNRYPADRLYPRPLGPNGTSSIVLASKDHGNSSAWVEQRTTLHVQADFTEDVMAYVELDSIDNWSEDFRSNYITGADSRADSTNDIEVYQAYIQAENMLGMPVRLRVGRQELAFGSEWLVGTNFYQNPLTYLSFDAVRLTYDVDTFSVDAFWSKLAENGNVEEDGDVDFYGLYATYKGIENHAIDAYIFYLRDAARRVDTDAAWTSDTFVDDFTRELFEDLTGRDDYDPTNLYTAGLRFAGEAAGFDYEIEAAYQWGDASAIGALFAPIVYGDDDAEFDNWGGHFTLGYSFDAPWQPHVYIGAEYYGGEDNRDIGFFDRFRVLKEGNASVSFNRLFSSYEADWFFDGSYLSNAWIGKVGASATPLEPVEVGLDVLYLETLEPFDAPVSWRVGHFYIPVAQNLPCWTTESDTDLGWETVLWVNYAYSDDVLFEVGWSHLFTGDALKRGAYSDANGLANLQGLETDDGDYFWFGSTLTF